MNGRVRKWFVATWLLAVAVLVGCAAPKAPGAGGKDPIRIGLLVEETGQFAAYGEEYINTAKIVIEDINKAGGISGRPLEAVYYNNESNPEKAITGAQKLIRDDKVVAVVGMGLVANSNAVAPLVKEGPVTYSLSGAYVPGHKSIFAASVSVPDMQLFIMDWLKKRGMSKLALLTPNDASGQAAEAGLKQVIGKAGLTLVGAESFNPNDVDVTTQLTRLRDLKPDAIMCWVVGKPLGVVLKGYNQLGIQLPFVASHGNLSHTFLDSLKDIQPKTFLIPATKDLAWRELPENDPQAKVNKEYHEKYLQRYGKEVGLGGGTMYDALYLLADAMKKVGTDSSKIIAHLEGVRGWAGVSGVYNFSADDHRGLGLKDAIMMQVVGGKLTLAK